MEVDSNQILIDTNTAAMSSSFQSMCDSDTVVSRIRSRLSECFSFQIIDNFLTFLNPQGQVSLKMTRVPSKQKSLSGIWRNTWAADTISGVREQIRILN